MDDAINVPALPSAPVSDDLDCVLEFLTLAIAADSDLPKLAARFEAQRVYAEARRDYLRTGNAIYGDSHAGLVRWLAEQIAPAPAVLPDTPHATTS